MLSYRMASCNECWLYKFVKKRFIISWEEFVADAVQLEHATIIIMGHMKAARLFWKVFSPALVVASVLAGVVACPAAEDKTSAAAAVVTALSQVAGYGFSNQWVRVKHTEEPGGIHVVSLWTKTGKNLPEIHSKTIAPQLLAEVKMHRRGKVEVAYSADSIEPSGGEGEFRTAIAYLAFQGWLTPGFWMKCDRRNGEASVFFWTEPNRWPGDHGTVIISKNGIRYIGGA